MAYTYCTKCTFTTHCIMFIIFKITDSPILITATRKQYRSDKRTGAGKVNKFIGKKKLKPYRRVRLINMCASVIDWCQAG